MIDYILTLAISFAGVFAGGFLAIIASEELNEGKKYLEVMKWAVLAIIIAAVFYFSPTIWALIIAVLLVVLKILKKEYPALAFALAFSYLEGFLFVAGSLIFIYGLPAGTINAEAFAKKKEICKMALEVIKKNFLYLAFGLAILPFILAYA